ncbi:MAG: restriction endonuclease subunit S [Bacteroidales bacterium]|nr:restriction endonuclease subunit S [Bacteroidales bacterium]
MQELERQFKADGGTFKEYRIGEFFIPLKGRKKLSKLNLSQNGNIPVYSSDSNNNGITGYTDLTPDYIVDTMYPLYVVFGDHTRTLNIADKSFCVMDNVKVFIPKYTNIQTLLYIFAVWKKGIPNLGYARHWSVASKVKLSLPTINSEIAFSYMESVSRELQDERISKLTDYLNDSGLENTELSLEEKDTVVKLREGNVEWKEFNICGETGIFNVNNTHSIMQSQIVPNSGDYPYVTASESNNSIATYVNYDMEQIEKGNSIMIGGKTLVITYQESDYFSNDSHNIACYVKDEKGQTKEAQLFLISTMYKSMKPKYSWGDSISGKKIKKDTIYLPITSDGEIDWDFMHNLISAESRLAIRGVVEWKDRLG